MYQAMTRTDYPDFTTPGLMKKGAPISALFVDIGGVLLTNGWDHQCPPTGGEPF